VVLLAVIGFGSSDKLAGAYGIADRHHAGHHHPDLLRDPLPLEAAGCCAGPPPASSSHRRRLFSASTLKLFHGGWFPLLLGAVLFTVMLTWKRGRQLVFQNLQKHDSAGRLPPRCSSRRCACPARPSSCAARATACRTRCCTTCAQQGAARARGVPHRHMHEEPWVAPSEQVKVRTWATSATRSTHYGFKDEPDIPRAAALRGAGTRSR
jgi:KUP system potassium uptake protein